MPKSKSKSKATARAAKSRVSRPQDDVVRFYSNRLDAFRLPDTATSATAVLRLPQDSLIVANATGDAAFALDPALINATSNNTVTAGNLGSSWPPVAHPSITTVSNNTTACRMTGHRITVRYSGPEQTTSGTMYVGSSLSYSGSMISAPVSNFTQQMQAYPMKAGGMWTFYAPMFSVPDFQALSGVWMKESWMGVVFLFSGLPANSSYVTIRSERSIEYVPDISSSILVETVPEPYDPVGMTEAGILSGTGPEESPTLAESYATKVGQAAWNMVRGTARGVVDAARADMRDLMAQNQMNMLLN